MQMISDYSGFYSPKVKDSAMFIGSGLVVHAERRKSPRVGGKLIQKSYINQGSWACGKILIREVESEFLYHSYVPRLAALQAGDEPPQHSYQGQQYYHSILA